MREISEHGTSVRLVDRLRGQYAVGPHLPNGNPEFGWRQFEAPPIQHDAAARIEALEDALAKIAALNDLSDYDDQCSAAYGHLAECEEIARTALGD